MCLSKHDEVEEIFDEPHSNFILARTRLSSVTMKHMSSPQSGQRNVKMKERYQHTKQLPSNKWRKSIAEFKTKQRVTKIKGNNGAEIPAQDERQFIDPNISFARFNTFDESIHRMWNMFNWGQSIQQHHQHHLHTSVRYNHHHHNPGYSHGDHSATFHLNQLPLPSGQQRKFKMELVNVEDLLNNMALD